MPYIRPQRRQDLDTAITTVENELPDCNTGDFTYIIYRLMSAMVQNSPSYAKYSGIIGAIECAKAEFYRRKIAPYEDTKIIENGDV